MLKSEWYERQAVEGNAKQMNITVDRITRQNVVHFTSPFGDCIGIWSAGTPQKSEYSVELDLAQIEDASVIQETRNETPALWCEDDTIYIRGLLDDYEDDGFMTLRLDGTFLCVETPYDERVARLKGRYVELSADCLYLCDGRLL